jgi:hypothetical protein
MHKCGQGVVMSGVVFTAVLKLLGADEPLWLPYVTN